jgi:hypothetical protein
MEVPGVIFFLLIAGLIVAGIVYSILAAKKRRQEMADLAARLGLTFNPERDYDLAEQFEFLSKLRQGDNRYAYNILRGDYRGHTVLAFDYHFETHSTDSKGHRHTHHHHLSFFMMFLPRQVPELTIVREGLFSKIAQAFGYDDIDFESAEFSRKFCVRSKDRRFAYDVCHARFMEYLLANDDLSLEFENRVVAFGFDRQLAPADIERNLNRLLEVRELLPAYLFNPA